MAQDTVMSLEKLADSIVAGKNVANMKQAAIKNIPRQALLKPGHAANRLREQIGRASCRERAS